MSGRHSAPLHHSERRRADVAGGAPETSLLTAGALDAYGKRDDARGKRGRTSLRRMLATADAAAATTTGVLAGSIAGLSLIQLLIFTVVVGLGWPLFAFLFGLYATDDPPSWTSGVPEAKRIVIVAVLLSWPLWGLAKALGAGHPAAGALAAIAFFAVLSASTRGAARSAANRMTPLRQRTLILGTGHVASQVIKKLQNQPELGLHPVGVVDDDPHPEVASGLPHLGRREDLAEILSHNEVDRVIVAFSRATHAQLLSCMRVCWDKGVAIDVIPRLFELLDGARRIDRLGGIPVLSIDTPNLGRPARGAKRLLDVAVAGSALVLLAPFALLLALAIKIDSRGPVLFGQIRAGRDGEPFTLFKFRSMHTGADRLKAELSSLNDVEDGVMFKIRDDPRFTRLGRLLRRSSLDELPQLWNVLRGHMSLVGPRPLVLPENAALDEPWHARRLDLRPGMTGPWQVYGRSNIPFEDMLRLDYQYVAGWSLSRDVEILLSTIPAVLSGRGAY